MGRVIIAVSDGGGAFALLTMVLSIRRVVREGTFAHGAAQ
jgi:hypothetical protein